MREDSKTVGVVAHDSDLKQAREMSQKIHWINGTKVEDYSKYKALKIVFFTDELDDILRELQIKNFNAQRAGQKVFRFQEIIFTSVRMVELVSQMNNEQAELFVRLRQERFLSDDEIAKIVFKRLCNKQDKHDEYQ